MVFKALVLATNKHVLLKKEPSFRMVVHHASNLTKQIVNDTKNVMFELEKRGKESDRSS